MEVSAVGGGTIIRLSGRRFKANEVKSFSSLSGRQPFLMRHYSERAYCQIWRPTQDLLLAYYLGGG